MPKLLTDYYRFSRVPHIHQGRILDMHRVPIHIQWVSVSTHQWLDGVHNISALDYIFSDGTVCERGHIRLIDNWRKGLRFFRCRVSTGTWSTARLVPFRPVLLICLSFCPPDSVSICVCFGLSYRLTKPVLGIWFRLGRAEFISAERTGVSKKHFCVDTITPDPYAWGGKYHSLRQSQTFQK